jgi:L-ascorbate metabolism protein UlaG (beta-lactamase superfamily)
MKITYVHHSSFLVESESATLLFDWFEGTVPPVDREKRLFVFASHRHADHFDPAVFSRFGDHPEVLFVLSADIPAKKVPGSVAGRTRSMKRRDLLEEGPLTVRTFRSTDEGVAFLVSLDGRTIYHAGDLNHWFWEGEDAGWNKQMGKNYLEEIALLPSDLDVAFVPVDPRLGDAQTLGARELAEGRTIGSLFPMHFWGDFSVCDKCRESLAGQRCTVMQISRKNQSWRLS